MKGGTERQARCLPRVEMSRRIDGPTHPLVLPDRPILAEIGKPLDTRGVHLLVLVDLVERTITCKVADKSDAYGRVDSTEIFEDVVLDERVNEPTIDG